MTKRTPVKSVVTPRSSGPKTAHGGGAVDHLARRLSGPTGFVVVSKKPKHQGTPGQPIRKAKGPLEHLPAAPAPADPRHSWALGSKLNPAPASREASRLAHEAKTGQSYAGYHTTHERHALRGYTREPSAKHPGADYEAINHHLAGTSQAPQEHQAHSKLAAQHINQAISHSKLGMNMTLHRGGHLPQGIKEGDVISSPRLTSTTYSPLAAKRFKTDHPDHATIKIKARKGDNAYSFAKHDNSDHEESEILFGSHHKFHVHSVKTDAKGRRTVTLGTYPAKPKKLAAPAPAPLAKSVTLAAYQASVAQATAPGHMSDDDKYAWAAYQRMFDANHQHMADAAAEAVARAYLRQGSR